MNDSGEELRATSLSAVMVCLDAALKCCALLHPTIGFHAESRICDSGSLILAKAGQLAVNHASNVASVSKKLRDVFARANERSPAVVRGWILLNPAHVMPVK
jgi:hypothetical protein